MSVATSADAEPWTGKFGDGACGGGVGGDGTSGGGVVGGGAYGSGDPGGEGDIGTSIGGVGEAIKLPNCRVGCRGDAGDAEGGSGGSGERICACDRSGEAELCSDGVTNEAAGTGESAGPSSTMMETTTIQAIANDTHATATMNTLRR